MVRPLPTTQEALEILSRRRSRPPPRPPPAAGRALTATLKALDARFGKGSDGLKARWRDIVGADLARRTEPVRLTKARAGQGGALEVRVEGAAAAIIQHRAPDILARVNLFLGTGSVGRLRIVQGPLKGPVARPPPAAGARRRLGIPLDAEAEQALAEAVAPLPEGPLKDALARLGRAVMRDSRR